ncbi:MAG TPA: permease [Terriglobales bacterium]|nr:permease [Terriglobales bacterium]
MATAAPLPLALAPTSRRAAVLTTILLAIVAGTFWIDSRYPALIKKMHQGPAVKVAGAITFDKVLNVDRSMPLPKRVAYTTVNWLAANRVGMSFGFLFGAGLLTLLAGAPRSGSRYKNVLFGTLAGVPLGVCSNCVAPITQGLCDSGVATESALATMLSSPTLNVVVLATVFSLFPLPLAILKIGLTLLVLFAVIPFIAPATSAASKISVSAPAATVTWGEAFGSTIKSYLKNLWYLLRTAGPLMLLAAALGSLIIELWPREMMPVAFSPLKVVLVAMVGTALPVPMAFDVFAAYVAMRSGVPLPYVATLLCTLGAYSVYSFFITGRAVSWKTAASIFAAICATGILAGFLAALL